jgi:hypothetical protein
VNKMIPSIRRALDNNSILQNLGLLTDFAGTWHGKGFNLVARPFFGLPGPPPIPAANLFLELNLTDETLEVVPISSSIPNRGTFQEDLELFGLTYLQKISDATTGGALHIEPGIWITHGATTDPVEDPPADGQIVARMGSIPHGNALLAGGFAKKFQGPPTLGAPTTAGIPTGSIFPSFNTTPLVIAAAPPPLINAAGASEFLTAPAGGFLQYTLTNAASATNPRTPFLDDPPTPLPAVITQKLLNDPITLLQDTIQRQVAEGCTFEGVAINISTRAKLNFVKTASTVQPPAGAAPPPGPTVSVDVADAAGGIENLPFLETNADSALVFATFWIEKVTQKSGTQFMQLQYAQFVFLDFPAVLIPAPAGSQPPIADRGKLNFSWPHVSVGTLQKIFGGQ